jgi:Zn-dependent protease with chaperone function
MHLIVMAAIFALAWGLRYAWTPIDSTVWLNAPPQRLHQYWERTLTVFLLPPLLLFTSAIAIIWMGPHGRMVWVGNDWFSYDLAIGFLGFAAVYWCKLAGSGWQMLQQVRTCPIVTLNDTPVRLLDLSTLYSAQIGFWEPELVVTTALIDTLSSEHLAAVLAHERAHYLYRDTWYFFWWGWVRQITNWLPQTEAIWQELLMLREIRADRLASSQTDPLLVAEALLSIVQSTPVFADNICAAFGHVAPIDRLDRRIEALLSCLEPIAEDRSLDSSWRSWAWLSIAFLPFLAVPFHN